MPNTDPTPTFSTTHPRAPVAWVQHLDRHAVQLADSVAVVSGGQSLTWQKLRERVRSLAGALTVIGVERGDRVLLVMTNGVEYVESLLAVQWIGAISVPINFRFSSDEMLRCIDGTTPLVAIISPALRDAVSSAAERARRPVALLTIGSGATGGTAYEEAIRSARPVVQPAMCESDDIALIMYTGGTTGDPKGAMLCHANMASQAVNFARAMALVRNDDVVLIPSPLFHMAGIGVLAPCLMFGLRVVIASSSHFDPASFVDTLEREQITATGMVPTQWQDVCALPGISERNHRLHTISWGAAPATPALLRDMARAFPGVSTVAIFGQTEMSPLTCVLEGQDALQKLGSVGRPVASVDIRIVDENMNDVGRGEVGEIVYRGPGVMLGYWNNELATAEAFHGGWFHSGDLVKQDADGYVWVVDRIKDMIISGGENIYCAELEAVIGDHPNVADVAVVGMPDERWGETPVAFVVAPSEGRAPTAEDVIEFCKTHLAAYKKPGAVRIVKSLPRTAAGKVDKIALRAKLDAKI